MQMVDLRGLGLTTFPVEIYTIPSITALHLDDNYLQARAEKSRTFENIPDNSRSFQTIQEVNVAWR